MPNAALASNGWAVVFILTALSLLCETTTYISPSHNSRPNQSHQNLGGLSVKLLIEIKNKEH